MQKFVQTALVGFLVGNLFFDSASACRYLGRVWQSGTACCPTYRLPRNTCYRPCRPAACGRPCGFQLSCTEMTGEAISCCDKVAAPQHAATVDSEAPSHPIPLGGTPTSPPPPNSPVPARPTPPPPPTPVEPLPVTTSPSDLEPQPAVVDIDKPAGGKVPPGDSTSGPRSYEKIARSFRQHRKCPHKRLNWRYRYPPNQSTGTSYKRTRTVYKRPLCRSAGR